jgi:hypothetical protein
LGLLLEEILGDVAEDRIICVKPKASFVALFQQVPGLQERNGCFHLASNGALQYPTQSGSSICSPPSRRCKFMAHSPKAVPLSGWISTHPKADRSQVISSTQWPGTQQFVVKSTEGFHCL